MLQFKLNGREYYLDVEKVYQVSFSSSDCWVRYVGVSSPDQYPKCVGPKIVEAKNRNPLTLKGE